MPFTGDFRGCTWSSQALFAGKLGRHGAKVHQARTLLATHDFVGLQETHSVEGRARILPVPLHSVAFYPHGTTRVGWGVYGSKKNSYGYSTLRMNLPGLKFALDVLRS